MKLPSFFSSSPQPTKRMIDLEDDVAIVAKKISQVCIAMDGLAQRLQKLEGRFYQHMGSAENEQPKKEKTEEETLYAEFNKKFF